MIQPRYTDSTSTELEPSRSHVEHAAAGQSHRYVRGRIGNLRSPALEAHEASDALAALRPVRARRAGEPGPATPCARMGTVLTERPRMPVAHLYSLAESRHMAVYRTEPEQLAAIAVSTRECVPEPDRADNHRRPLRRGRHFVPYVAEPLPCLDAASSRRARAGGFSP